MDSTGRGQGMPELGKVGFVGFGSMAKLMAKRLRLAGFDVSAFDVGYKQQELEGFTLRPDASSLVQQVDVVVISLPDDDALAQVADGAKGMFAGEQQCSLLLNTSTVSVEASKKLARAASSQGIRFVECPVSGSTPQAEVGELIILAGGEADDIAFAKPIFQVIGQRTVHAGPVGQGLVLKFLINGVMALSVAALAEGIAFGVAAGLNRENLIDTLKGLSLTSEHDQPKLDMICKQTYPVQFPTKLLVKDLGLLLAHASKQGTPMVCSAAASQLYLLGASKHGTEDYTAVMATLETFAL